MTHPNNTPQPSETLDKHIANLIEQHLIAYGCKECGGGGYDYDNKIPCLRCKGLGIVDFETKYIVDKFKALIDTAVAEELEKIPQFEVEDTPGNAVQYIIDRLRELRTTGNGQAGQKEEA